MPNIGSNNVRDALLGKGYFPKELPPAFTSADFGRFSMDILAEWKAAKVFTFKPTKKKANAFEVRTPITECEIISTPKLGYARRPISVVHPIAQGLLANEIGEHWPTICKWLQRQRYSIDNLKVGDKYSPRLAYRPARAVSNPVLFAHARKKCRLL